ncbi:MAG TPA: hypothetical protein VF668_03195 [Pyrinomonadaceae bacterium]|jgi:uncharacterized repeat protein (TIGR01451 family)
MLLALCCAAGLAAPGAAYAQRFGRQLSSRAARTAPPAPKALGAPRVAAAALAAADLTVTKSGDESAPVGGDITYNIVVTNGGPDEAAGVVLTDPIPANTTFVSADSPTGGTVSFSNNTLTVTFASIPAFESGSVVLVVRVNSDTRRNTTISNTATATSDTPDPNPDDNSATALTAVTGPFAGDLLISEFRLRGPNGTNDEFVEIYNNSDAPLAVNVADASAGFSLVASDGVARCTIPAGTIIPARGHYLCVNSVGYSLAGYPAGNGTTATGDATYTTDIPDNAGIALFRTSDAANFTPAYRLDAVGSTSEANALYKEGAGYPALTPFSIDYAFYRDLCGKGGSITTLGPCPSLGFPRDTNNNAADFVFVDTNGTSAGAGQRLGAPGPQNLSSPVQRNEQFAGPALDTTRSAAVAPNRVRDLTSDPANNSTFGTLDIRKRIVNDTGQNATRLRFRVIDVTTFPAPAGFADLRPRTSTPIVVGDVRDSATCLASTGAAATPCTVTIQGTTLEQPPSQPNGGGFNSSLSADTVTLATPLAPGESVNVRFLLGIQQTGTFKFFVNVEALTADPEEVIPPEPQQLTAPPPPPASLHTPAKTAPSSPAPAKSAARR